MIKTLAQITLNVVLLPFIFGVAIFLAGLDRSFDLADTFND